MSTGILTRRPFTRLEGKIHSTARDLAMRMERVYDELKSRGWTVVVESIDTDPNSLTRGFTVWLWRESATPEIASSEFERIMNALRVEFGWIGTATRMIKEFVVEVVRPSVVTGGSLALLGVGAWFLFQHFSKKENPREKKRVATRSRRAYSERA